MTNMKNIFESGSITNGIVAFGVISLIAFGCTCDDFDNIDSDAPPSTANEWKLEHDQPFENIEEAQKVLDTEEMKDNSVPSDKVKHALVEISLRRFNDALNKGDFTEFVKDLHTKSRKVIKPGDLNKEYRDLIDRKIDISAITKDVPIFTRRPHLDLNTYGVTSAIILHGKYKTKPEVVFEFDYFFEDRVFKLGELKVRVNEEDK